MVSFFLTLKLRTEIMEKTQNKRTVKFFNGKEIPLEMHKVRIVQSLKLVPVEQRLRQLNRQDLTHFC